MKARSIILSAIVISTLLAQLTFAALPRYEIIDLGTLGGIHSAGRSINDKGHVVGYAENSLGLERATLFDPTGNGNNIDLGTLDGQYSDAYSINRDGQIVGQAYTASGYWRATLFHPTGEGNNTDLGTLGGNRSKASSINDNGQIVGWAQIASGEIHATLFDPTGGEDNIDLGTLGGDESWASSINNSSQIVGTAYHLFTSPGGRFPPVTSSYLRATLFDATGQGNNIDLGTLLYTYGVCCCSGAMSINDSGQIVGAAWNEDPFPFAQEMAVLFDPTGGENNIFLGTLGGYGSFAYSINNRAQIIGWGGLCSNNLCGTRPAIFDPTGQGNNVNLYDLIDPSCGWILKEVWSINDSGWIVGEGINPDGETHAFLMTPIPPKIIYIDDDAAGANDGSSWADAFNYLQDALAVAWSGDEIHVAEGVYKPDRGAVVTTGDREATFQLINGVTLKGGYAGAGAPDPNARDIQLYQTILTGDLEGNDVDVNDPTDLLEEPTRAENSYHVVTAVDTDETTVLDGFTITAGKDDQYGYNQWLGWIPDGRGGGMYNSHTNAAVVNCIFRENTAMLGGAVYNDSSNPKFTDCTFVRNLADTNYPHWDGSGGGMYNSESSFTKLRGCVFRENTARRGGGLCGRYIEVTASEFYANSWSGMSGIDIVVTDCIFKENWGDAMSCVGGEVKGCTFTSNLGRGIFIGGDSHVSNCLFTGNIGGLQAEDCDIVITNCSFIGNITSAFFAGIWNDEGDTTVINCISWGNIGKDGMTESAQIATHDPAVINYCCIQDWSGALGGTGNTGADPYFVSEGYWDPLPDYNDDYWERNIHWIDGDYHLLPDSPCIDSGDPNYVAGPNETDLDGKPRVMGGRVDMGAYEVPIPAEARIVPRTINLASKGKSITCYIRLPEGYDLADIDPNSVLLEQQIKAEQFSVDEHKQVATATFDREKVQSILNVGDIELTITCQLTDGTYFEATDVVKVTDKGGGK